MFRHSKGLRLGWVTAIVAGTVIGVTIFVGCQPKELGIKPAADFLVSIAVNGSVDLANKSKFGFYCKWDFGDGSRDTINWSPCHTYPSNGTYEVKLTVIGAGDQSTISTQTVIVTNSFAGSWELIASGIEDCVDPSYDSPEQPPAAPHFEHFSIPYCHNPEYPLPPVQPMEVRGDSLFVGTPVYIIYVLSGDSLTGLQPLDSHGAGYEGCLYASKYVRR